LNFERALDLRGVILFVAIVSQKDQDEDDQDDRPAGCDKEGRSHFVGSGVGRLLLHLALTTVSGC